nr:prospero homeobox protein 2-like [Gasterosteus aculeatus aculeatus]
MGGSQLDLYKYSLKPSFLLRAPDLQPPRDIFFRSNSMNPSVWSRVTYPSSSFCVDGFPARHVSSFQLDTVRLNSEVSGLSESSHKDSEDIRMPPQGALVTDDTAGHLPARKRAHHEWNSNGGRRAKRARVENIIKGMSGSPGARCAGDATSRHREPDGVRENERIGPGGEMTCEQPEHQHQHLRQLRTGLSRVGARPTRRNHSPESSPTVTDWPGEFQGSSGQTHQGRKKVKLMDYFQSKPDRIKLMADLLKYELGRAVSRSVDSIFKSAPVPRTSPDDEEGVETDASLRPPVGEHEMPDVQTEALSLVVQKLPRGPEPPVPIGGSALRKVGTRRALGCAWEERTEGPRAKCETFDARWRSVKVRSKVNSRSVRSPERRAGSTGDVLLESPKAHVKSEPDGLRNNLYVLNEGLTTNHLKKAKHMFFYTRYPSSLVLKMCFYDVQFTRCITSQLIKWFSNFREFYYIQMEKFARHAVADVRSLTVGRESELFRALNVHYNKANDFQVPDRFLEVAEITLREFYVAISMGKDRDPSWKKPIYKVICKLDSDVAAEFKSHPSG